MKNPKKLKYDFEHFEGECTAVAVLIFSLLLIGVCRYGLWLGVMNRAS